KTFRGRDQSPSRSLPRCTVALELPLDGQIVRVENHSCGRRTSSPTAAAVPASPLAGGNDPAPSGCQAFAPRRPAWGFPPASPARAGSSPPPHRLRFVGPVQQSFSDHWPVLFQVVAELINGDPVHSRATFITLYLSQCCLQVLSLTYFLHQPIRSSGAFGSTRRH